MQRNDDIGGTTEEGDDSSGQKEITVRVSSLLKAGAFLAFATFVLVLALQIQVGSRNRSLSEIEDSVHDLQEAVNEMEIILDDTKEIAESFVQKPDAQAAQQAQLERVFRQIEEIHGAIVGGG